MHFLPIFTLKNLSSLLHTQFQHPLAMAATDTPPRFFKVFISHFSSDSMMIPISYYDQLPCLLPKTAILQGTGGCFWNVSMKKKREEVNFEQGWSKFVKDNSLSDGDFLTFVYDGDRTFEVSIYGPDGCKETRAVTEVEDDSICSLSSDETDTSSESEMANTIPRSKNKGKSKVEDSDNKEDSVYSLNSEDIDTDTCSEFKKANTISRSKNRGKSKVVEESDDKEDSVYSLSSEDTEIDTCSEFKMVNTIQRSKNKGKKKVEIVESSDSDYIEAFSHLDFEESSNGDSSYSPGCKNTTTHVKPKATYPKKKGKSKSIEDEDAISDSPCSIGPAKKREQVKIKIKNPEAYLDNPKNVHFETGVKNRNYELLVHAQLVKDYGLKFKDHICYIDPKGALEARTARWKDQRVCIKRWMCICKRNKLNKKDRILCELLRKGDLVYAIKIHIIRGKYL